MQHKIRVGIVDDHPLYRDGVVFALESEPDMEVVAQGETANDAFQIAQGHAPDVLVMDMNLPGGGMNAIMKIAPRYPSTKILMLTVVDDQESWSRGGCGHLRLKVDNSALFYANLRQYTTISSHLCRYCHIHRIA